MTSLRLNWNTFIPFCLGCCLCGSDKCSGKKRYKLQWPMITLWILLLLLITKMLFGFSLSLSHPMFSNLLSCSIHNTKHVTLNAVSPIVLRTIWGSGLTLSSTVQPCVCSIEQQGSFLRRNWRMCSSLLKNLPLTIHLYTGQNQEKHSKQGPTSVLSY